MAQIKIYGIPNCDTTQKAIKWLREHNLGFDFIDYKTEGITSEKLQEWTRKSDWTLFLNKRSTTWRGLTTEVQNSVVDIDSAIAVLQKHTSLIKRPVIEYKGGLMIGFDTDKMHLLL